MPRHRSRAFVFRQLDRQTVRTQRQDLFDYAVVLRRVFRDARHGEAVAVDRDIRRLPFDRLDLIERGSKIFDELVVALFLSGTGAVTLPRRMWEDLRYAIDPTIAAVSTLTIVLTAALLGIAHYLRKRSEQNRTLSS